jgi:phosphoribosylamine--glycine ligase
MLTASGPKVVEFNVRFGDPEAQVLFPMLSEDLSPLLVSAATGHLPSRSAYINQEPHVGVVLAAGGYPGVYERDIPIEGLDKASAVPGAFLFHAGTGTKNGRIVTTGGRILTVVGRGLTYRDAIDVAYSATDLVHFKGMHYRRDIGFKALENY